MRQLDWIVLAGSLVFIVAYGLWRSRDSGTVNKYLLAGKSMPWYAMALSIMATQASAITFISTTGQAYVDGMRFVQYYFGLPLAMVILCATAVPIFHGSGVYTAYEYLERRFDTKTRTLVGSVFLIQRGLGAGIALYAPAIVLTIILGWPDHVTTLVMGILVITYTVIGGIKAVTWTDFQQMLIMMAGLLAALVLAVAMLPDGVSFTGALTVAGAANRLNAITLNLDWNDRYNLWSGLLGGMFLALAYFGCDQSQVQRYLTGKSVAQSRLSLLFNAVAKVPMQFFILFTGAMVFVFFVFEKPPLLFHPQELERIERGAESSGLNARYQQAFDKRRASAVALIASSESDPARKAQALKSYRAAQRDFDATRSEAVRLVEQSGGERGLNDTNFIFLTFVTRYLPAGVVGLVLAAIFAAAMSTISAEVNSLATVSVIDIYRRHFRRNESDRHYLWASRLFTAFWGLYAVFTSQFGRNLGSLVEAVNLLGSFFYGSLLGVFTLAFFFPRVTANGAFYGVLAGEAAILAVHITTDVSFLWYNVIAPVAVIAAAVLISRIERRPSVKVV